MVNRTWQRIAELFEVLEVSVPKAPMPSLRICRNWVLSAIKKQVRSLASLPLPMIPPIDQVSA